MKEITSEKLGEIMVRAKKIKYDALAQVYIAAAMMAEAEATPAEMVAYMEERFMEA